MPQPKPSHPEAAPLKPLPALIFASRWLQLPLYLGLIAAQAVYVYHFWVNSAKHIDSNKLTQGAGPMTLPSRLGSAPPKNPEGVTSMA